MTGTHNFILTPGYWLGEGTIKFAESPDWLKFYTRWNVSADEAGMIEGFQEVEVDGVPEKMQNRFIFSDVTPSRFLVRLDNALFGEIDGTGVIDEKCIAWEFREGQQHGFEGFEVYELQPEGDYKVRAEYASSDQLRTTVEGRIWKAERKEKYEL